MTKTFNPTRLLVSLLLAGVPLLAAANELVVGPPVPPTGVQAKPVEVLAPATVATVRAGAEAPAAKPTNPTAPAPAADANAPRPPADILDVVLPAAPVDKAPEKLLPPPPPPVKAKPAATTAKASDAPRKQLRLPEPAPAPVDAFASLTTTPVSDSQLNRFVFPEKVEGVYFPEGAPLPTCADDAGPSDPCKPLFLNNRHMMLLQLKAGAKGPIQMLVHLNSGQVVTLNLAPGHGPGAVVRIEGAEDGVSEARLAAKNWEQSQRQQALSNPSDNERYVDLVSQFANGAIPAGFEPTRIGQPTQFSHFEVIPLASWTDGAGIKAHLMQVKAYTDQPVVIHPGLFRSATVRGVALDKDAVTNQAPGTLYLVEKVSE